MPATAKLSDIVDALEMLFDEVPSFFDRETGKVETISREFLREAEASDEEDGDDEDDEDIPKWQKESAQLAKLITFSPGDRFVELPTKFDVHEWAIMEEFSHSVKSETIREDLLYAIHGAGAFRHFKDKIHRHGIEKAWYAFRTEALRQIAIDWCEEHDIAWE